MKVPASSPRALRKSAGLAEGGEQPGLLDGGQPALETASRWPWGRLSSQEAGRGLGSWGKLEGAATLY